MEGHCSTGQSPQWAVVPVEDEEEEVFILKYFLFSVKYAPPPLQISVSKYLICTPVIAHVLALGLNHPVLGRATVVFPVG